MDVTIAPGPVTGTTTAPPSKSYTHRAVLAAGFTTGTTVENPLVSADTRATARAVRAFGATVSGVESGGPLTVEGFGAQPQIPADVIDCANSGTTIRLMTATAARADGYTVLTGDESLRTRPQGPLLDAVEQLGGWAQSTRDTGEAPLVVAGPITGGRVTIPGDVSSQFVTALLMAGATTGRGIDVTLETPLKSAPYVTITREVLEAFGIETTATEDGFAVPGGQQYPRPNSTYRVPGDFSSLSYLLAAGALAAPDGLRVTDVPPGVQGDSAIVDILDDMGAAITWDRGAHEITVAQRPLHGTTVSVADTPDLLPTIAALGAHARGTTRIVDCEHVRYKETDRVAAMAAELTKLGVNVEERPDTLIVEGTDTLAGGPVVGHEDHRIIMALSVAGLAAEAPITVTGAGAVDVSFPTFFEALESIGAELTRQ